MNHGILLSSEFNASNRTYEELKSWGVISARSASTASNRTYEELKWLLIIVRTIWLSFQSYLWGIEMFKTLLPFESTHPLPIVPMRNWNPCPRTTPLIFWTSNRTYEELKSDNSDSVNDASLSSNRTYEELKFFSDFRQKYGKNASNRTYEELKYATRRRAGIRYWTSNRTYEELKCTGHHSQDAATGASNRTYEELKFFPNRNISVQTFVFQSYLWGIEIQSYWFSA